MRRAAAIILAAALVTATPALAAKGKPELTAQTRASGGPMPADEAALRFDRADLAVEVFPVTERIAAIATHGFTALAPLTQIVLDLDRNLPVTAVALNGRALPAGSWSDPNGLLSIRLPREIAKGARFTVRIAYGGTPHVAVNAPWDGGFVWAKTSAGKPWVATAVQAEGCDLFWPCIDHPSGEPALMRIHVTVPPGLAAPSNGVLESIKSLPGGRRTYNWRVKRPNSYGVALNVGPYRLMKADYRSRFGNRIPMQLWYLEGHEEEAAGLFAEFAPTLDFFEAVIGPYPFGDEKMGVVETPHLGMEHQTINAYGNEYKKDATGYDWLFHHEFAHEWFGNQVTAADWDDFWLHEGFGSYMQPLYARWTRGEFAYHSALNESRDAAPSRIVAAHPLVSGRSRTAAEVDDDSTGPGADVYYKGAWLLHTLREYVGDAAFFDAVRRLVYGRPDPRPGNFSPRYGSSAEFRRLVNEATGRDLGWFFDVYLGEGPLPDLVTERRGSLLQLRWQVPHSRPFPMPVEVEVDGHISVVAMANGQGSLAVPAGAHMVLDPSAKILRRLPEIEALHAWQKRQAAAGKAKVQ